MCYGHRLSKILWQIWTQQDRSTLQYIKYHGSFGEYIAWHEIIAFPWSLITKVRRNLSLHSEKYMTTYEKPGTQLKRKRFLKVKLSVFVMLSWGSL